MATNKHLEKLSQLLTLATTIVESEFLSWSSKYDLLFPIINAYDVALDYCDPDTTYEEDTMAAYMAIATEFSKALYREK